MTIFATDYDNGGSFDLRVNTGQFHVSIQLVENSSQNAMWLYQNPGASQVVSSDLIDAMLTAAWNVAGVDQANAVLARPFVDEEIGSI